MINNAITLTELAENITKINLDVEDLAFESFSFLKHFEKTNFDLVKNFLNISNYLDILLANTDASVVLSVQAIILSETINFDELCNKVFKNIYIKHNILDFSDFNTYQPLIIALRKEIFSKVVSQHKSFIRKITDEELIEKRREIFLRNYYV